MPENEPSDLYFKSMLLKLLKQKIYANHSLPRANTSYVINGKVESYRINPEIAHEFYKVCYDLNLAGYRRGINHVLEAFMNLLIDIYENEPKQVTLMYKPTFKKEINIENLNITDKIELKLVKEDLKNVLLGFDMPDPSKNYVKQLNQHLKKVLPKAIQWKHMTQDPDLNELIIKAEKHLK